MSRPPGRRARAIRLREREQARHVRLLAQRVEIVRVRRAASASSDSSASYGSRSDAAAGVGGCGRHVRHGVQPGTSTLSTRLSTSVRCITRASSMFAPREPPLRT